MCNVAKQMRIDKRIAIHMDTFCFHNNNYIWQEQETKSQMNVEVLRILYKVLILLKKVTNQGNLNRPPSKQSVINC